MTSTQVCVSVVCAYFPVLYRPNTFSLSSTGATVPFGIKYRLLRSNETYIDLYGNIANKECILFHFILFTNTFDVT